MILTDQTEAADGVEGDDADARDRADPACREVDAREEAPVIDWEQRISDRLAAHHAAERAKGKILVPYSGDLLSPMPGLLDDEEGWRARERWWLRQLDQEWDDAEADLHDQPRTRARHRGE